METGVQLSNPTQNTTSVCIVRIVLQWCMYVLYVYIVTHSVINGCKLCMHGISSWLGKYETRLNCTEWNKLKFQDKPPDTKTTECVSSAQGGERRACQTGSDWAHSSNATGGVSPQLRPARLTRVCVRVCVSCKRRFKQLLTHWKIYITREMDK